MMDALIDALKRETASHAHACAAAEWAGDPAPPDDTADKLAALLLLAALNETAPAHADPLAVYASDAAPHRYATPADLRPFRTIFWEALQFLAKKSPILTVMSPRALDPVTRQTAFFVSSVMKGNLVQKIKDCLFDTRMKGESRGDFMQKVADMTTLSAPHMETVFRTNVMSAAGAARRQQMTDPDVADLFVGYRYVSKASADGHPYVGTRPLHAAMNGFIAVKDDPIWTIIWTPCGYNCRCAIRGVRKFQGVEAGLINEAGVVLTPRVYATSLQRKVVEIAESGGSMKVAGKLYVFPDEGFRGNALAGLVA